MVQPPLSDVETRVLGALLEKELTTPDVYPLSLAGLVTACNQTTNREPVTKLTDDEVIAAAVAMRRRGLVHTSTPAGSRVTKYNHLLANAMRLGRGERALMAVLMLRGPQTVGELHARTGRLADFADLDQIEGVLESLAARDPSPLVVQLARRPGQKETRWGHLLAGEPHMPEPTESTASSRSPGGDEALERRVEALEAEVASLRAVVDQLKVLLG